MNILEKIIMDTNATFKYFTKNLPLLSFEYSGPNGKQWVTCSPSSLKSATDEICQTPSSSKETITKNARDIINHLNYCSHPKGFKVAWDLKTDKLSFREQSEIIEVGGQLIEKGTFNNSHIFSPPGRKGVLLGPQQIKKKGPILAFRHFRGNYEDELDELGRFTYQPDASLTCMLRFRYFEMLSKLHNIPIIILIIMRFENNLLYDIHHTSKLKPLYMIIPAKIIAIPESADILNFNRLMAPLHLQTLNRKSALLNLEKVISLDNDKISIPIRAELSEKLALEFDYSTISKSHSKKAKGIKVWAQKNKKKCPGTKCGGKEFDKITELSEITFGHIISQNWAKAFCHLKDLNGHPDNIYLTCNKCNSSLNENFPDKKLRIKILNYGTLGDWLRLSEKEIRNEIR